MGTNPGTASPSPAETAQSIRADEWKTRNLNADTRTSTRVCRVAHDTRDYREQGRSATGDQVINLVTS